MNESNGTAAKKRITDADLFVARRLIAARHLTRMSQERAGAAIDVTFQQLQKYERGYNRISAGRLWYLANAYKLPVSWFFEGMSQSQDLIVDDVAANFLATPYGADVANAFSGIKNHEARRAVVKMCEALASVS